MSKAVDDLNSAERDATWMRLALEQARLAESQGEVPVGAVLVSYRRNARCRGIQCPH